MLVSAAATAAAQNSNAGNTLSGLLPLLLIVLVVVFFMSSSRRRRRTQEQMLSALVPGAMVVTTAGLYATVVEVDGNDVLLEVAPDVVCRFTKAAVVRVVTSLPGHEENEPHDTGGASDGPAEGSQVAEGDAEEKPRRKEL